MAKTNRRFLILAPVLLSVRLTYGADAPDLFYPQTFPQKNGTIPACAPLYMDISGEKTRRVSPGHAYSLRSRARHWKPVFMSEEDLSKPKPFRSFAECVRAAPDYEGRYTDEQLEKLSSGYLIAGSPFEFALAILGPPRRASYLSVLNPVTQKPETTTTYVWDRSEDLRSAALAFGIISGIALGVAAAASNARTAIRAAEVGAASSAAAAVLLTADRLAQANIVTVQVDEKKRLTMVGGQ